MKPWEAQIPKIAKNKDVKRCYTVWTHLWQRDNGRWVRAGGKVVWLTDKQLTFARIKYPKKDFEPVLERDRLEEYKKYLEATIE